MGQSLEGIRDSKPDPILRLDTTAASTTRLERYQRKIIVDASSGANTATVKLPAPGECEGDIFTFEVTGTTGTCKPIYGVTSWVLTGTTLLLSLMSDGDEYVAVQGPS